MTNARTISLLAVLCLLLFFPGLADIPFHTKGEPREAVVVWEIVTTGEWVLPLRNGTDIPSKPPLFHWLGALTSLAAGEVSELTVRLPSALLGTAGVLLTFATGARLWGAGSGLVAAVVLATSFEWWRAATSARVDMTLTFFMVAAFVLFLLLHREGKGGAGRGLLFALLLGLATLAKGPVGAILPGLTAVVFLWLVGDLGFLRKLRPLASAALFLAVAGSWYGLALWKGGLDFFGKQIVRENVLRFFATEAGGTGHEHPFYYLIPGFLLGMAPWSLFLPPLAVFLYRRRGALAREGFLYPLVWFGVVFVFFSVASGKRTVYLLPLYPAAALLLGAWWNNATGAQPEPGCGRFLRAGAYAGAALFTVAVAVMSASLFGLDLLRLLEPFLHPKDQAGLQVFGRFLDTYRAAIVAWLLVTATGVVLLVRATADGRPMRVFVCLAGLAAAALLLVNEGFRPTLAATRTFKPFMARVRLAAGHDGPLFFYRAFDYGALFYARRHIPRFQPSGARRFPPLFLTWEEEWEKLAVDQRPTLLALDRSRGTGPKGNHRLVLVAVGGSGRGGPRSDP
jgi:4-amino-4-deoxy-L-arabinose transferase-like glycosyltransferase